MLFNKLVLEEIPRPSPVVCRAGSDNITDQDRVLTYFASMIISRNCGHVLILLTSLPLLPLLVLSLLSVKIFQINQFVLKGLPVLHCSKVASIKEVYQHGNYWVLKNYVHVPEKHACEEVTLTIQGSHVDIYKLEELYYDGLCESPVSFAVYIANEQHLRQALVAIAYIRHCLPQMPATRKKNATLLPIAFHLYFRSEQMPRTEIPANAEHFLDTTPVNCKAKQVPLQELTTETKEQQQHAQIVGKNITEEAAITKYVLSMDVNTFPCSHFTTKFLRESMDNPKFSELRRKLLWRLPTFLVRCLQESEHEARRDRFGLECTARKSEKHFLVPNYEPFDQTKWLSADARFNVFTFKENFQKLLLYKSFFVSAANIVHLDERLGLTVARSEDLRILQLALQQHVFLVPHSVYVLHDISLNFLPSKAIPRNISEAIFKEYSIMLASSNKTILQTHGVKIN